MNWGYIKDKILVFGEDDYVFSDMFFSIIGEFGKVEDIETRTLYAFVMLKELMQEKLITVYRISEKTLEEYVYSSESDIEKLISAISLEWKNIGYSLQGSELFFCVTSTEKGIECVNRKTFLENE